MIKKIALLSLLSLLVNPAFASTDNASDTSSNNLVNLTYYAHPGTFVFEPTYSSSIHAGSGGSTVNAESLELYLTYGAFIDGLRFSVSASNIFEQYQSESGTYTYTGFTDPTFSVNYRLLDHNPAGLSLDVQLSYLPQIGKNTGATPTTSGSNLQGANSLSLAGTLFWTEALNELSVNASIYHRFAGSATNASEGIDYSVGSYWIFQSRIADRFHLSPQFFVEASALFTFAYTLDRSYPDTSEYTYHLPFRLVPTVELGYLYSKKVLLSAYVSGYNYSESYTNSFSNDSSANQNFGTTWGLEARFEF